MRPTCSLYVDAGYLLASAATRVSGSSLRSGINPNYDALVSALVAHVEERSGLPVLRVHWYDSGHNGNPDTVQERIALLPKVKLRLGRVGMEGQQKGVDVRIGLDLVAHARNNTSDVFFLVSGDDDLTEAVEDAQVHGTQIVVLAVPNAAGKPHAVSRHLLSSADELAVLPGSVIDDHVIRVEKHLDVPTPAAMAAIPAPALVPVQAPREEPVVAPDPCRSVSVPTPAALAGASSPRRVVPVAASERSPVPVSVMAYSSATGGPTTVMPGYGDDAKPERFDSEIDDVVARVFTAYRLSNSDDTIDVLKRSRPSIPSEVDRALLLDLSDVIGVYTIPEDIRFRLRGRFWQHVEATR